MSLLVGNIFTALHVYCYVRSILVSADDKLITDKQVAPPLKELIG